MKSSNEIIKEYVDNLTEGKAVYHSMIREEKIYLGLSQNKKLSEEEKQNCFVFEHYMFMTKRYHDETCALFKLLKFLELYLTDTKIVFFRKFPEVLYIKDFAQDRKRYQGIVRLSTDKTMRKVK